MPSLAATAGSRVGEMVDISVPPAAWQVVRVLGANPFEAHLADAGCRSSVRDPSASFLKRLPRAGRPCQARHSGGSDPYASNPRSRGRTADTMGRITSSADQAADLAKLLAIKLDDEPDGTPVVCRLPAQADEAWRWTRVGRPGGEHPRSAPMSRHRPYRRRGPGQRRCRRSAASGSRSPHRRRALGPMRRRAPSWSPSRGRPAIGRAGLRTSRRRRHRHGRARAGRVARWPCTKSACHAVKADSGTAAAWAWVMMAGFGHQLASACRHVLRVRPVTAEVEKAEYLVPDGEVGR